jgi:hypothetical protein
MDGGCMGGCTATGIQAGCEAPHELLAVTHIWPLTTVSQVIRTEPRVTGVKLTPPGTVQLNEVGEGNPFAVAVYITVESPQGNMFPEI